MKICSLPRRFLALVLSCVLFPFLFPLALAIWRETGLNPIFIQKRQGKNGKEFGIFKFRTMFKGSEPIYSETSLELRKSQEHRITPIGKFIRRYGIDEIPQLWNIVRGEMSFVGPRPPGPSVKSEAYEYSVLPGLTGLEQICSRRDATDYTPDDVKALNNTYCKNKSFWLDLKIAALNSPLSYF